MAATPTLAADTKMRDSLEAQTDAIKAMSAHLAGRLPMAQLAPRDQGHVGPPGWEATDGAAGARPSAGERHEIS